MFELFMQFTVSKTYKYIHTKTIWFCTYIIYLKNYKYAHKYIHVYIFIYMYNNIFTHCCFSVAKSCRTLCDLMNCSTPGVPVFHYLLEFACFGCSVILWLLCNPYVHLETTLPDAHWDFSESSNYSCNFGSWFFSPFGKHFILPFKITIRPLSSGVYFFK